MLHRLWLFCLCHELQVCASASHKIQRHSFPQWCVAVAQCSENNALFIWFTALYLLIVLLLFSHSPAHLTTTWLHVCLTHWGSMTVYSLKICIILIAPCSYVHMFVYMNLTAGILCQLQTASGRVPCLIVQTSAVTTCMTVWRWRCVLRLTNCKSHPRLQLFLLFFIRRQHSLLTLSP